MTTIRDALRRIQPQQQAVVRSPLASGIDVNRECKRLAEVSADFAQRATEARPLHAPLDPKLVWGQFGGAKYDLAALDPRQVRTLCVSPEHCQHAGVLIRSTGMRRPYERPVASWVSSSRISRSGATLGVRTAWMNSSKGSAGLSAP